MAQLKVVLEKPGIEPPTPGLQGIAEPATPGVQGIALIHYTTAA